MQSFLNPIEEIANEDTKKTLMMLAELYIQTRQTPDKTFRVVFDVTPNFVETLEACLK